MPHQTIAVNAPGYRPLMNLGGGVRQTLPDGTGDGWSLFIYGGINFGPFTRIEDYQVDVLYDDRMNRSGNQFTLTCVSTVHGRTVQQADSLCTQIRQVLTRPKLPLSLRGRAVGDMFVNAGGIRDIKNGPIPRVDSFEVLGQLTTRFRWTLTWCLPDCPDAVYTADMGVLSNTYTVSTVVDGGYTVRTINGKLVIPQNSFVLGARFPADAATRVLKFADGNPGSVFPLLPPYFRRGPYTYTLSQDRSELTYSVVDTQTGYQAPPPGCITADESHESSTDSAAFATWTVTLRGRYEIPFDGNPNDAVNAFLQFAAGRLFSIDQMLIQQKDENGNPRQGVMKGLVPRAFTASEPEVRGKRVVELSLTVWFASGFSNVLQQSGLWSPVANGEWQAWFGSMGAVFNPLGTAELDFDVTKDTYVDLCQPGNRLLGQRAPTTGVLGRQRPTPVKAETRDLRAALQPDPRSNWLYYTAWIAPETDDGVGGVRTLSGKPLTGTTDLVGSFNGMVRPAVEAVITGGVSELIGGLFGGGLVPPPAPPVQNGPIASGVIGVPTTQNTGVLDHIPAGTTWVERRSRPQMYIWFCGLAGRYGSEVPEPFLTFVVINGQRIPVIRCQRADDGPAFVQNPIPTPGVFGGKPVPMFKAKWRMRYGIVGPVPAGPIEVPPNPFTGNAQ